MPAGHDVVCASMCFHCVLYIGVDRPNIKELHNHVVSEVADNWKDLGTQLLDSGCLKILDIIESDHPHDAVKCCKKMFQKWLDTKPDATWNQLIEALNNPGIQRHYLASQIEQRLKKKGEV